MALIKNGRRANDPWRMLADKDAVPGDGPVIISLKRWTEEKPWLKGRKAPLGIRLQADQPPAIIEDDLERFEVIALEFPVFRDGRAYSYARLLRERHRFGGEVRAVGHILRDQIAFLLRCGFDAIEADGRAAEGWQTATTAFSAWYQPAADGEAPISARRRYAVPARATVPVLRSEPVAQQQPSPVEAAVCAATWAY
jgi:uncharacterized protein (DUF934 family)